MEIVLVFTVLISAPIVLILAMGRYFEKKGVLISAFALFSLVAFAWISFENNPDVGSSFAQMVLLTPVCIGTVIGLLVGYVRCLDKAFEKDQNCRD